MPDRRDLATLAVGDALPGTVTETVSRLVLALYCGASGDHNPVHVDIDRARAAGFDDVIAHGMLSMAWLARVLTDLVPQADVREFGVRFAAITRVGDTVTCAGTLVERFEVDGEARLRVALTATDARGEPKLVGDAVLRVA